jgi:nucleosome binding factor SPN SPT16 subunit
MKGSKAGKCLGVFMKHNFPGEFCESWRTALKDKDFEQVNVSAAIGYIMCPKEESEILTMKSACQVTVDVFTKYLKAQIIGAIRADKKVKHSELAEGVEQALTDEKYVSGVDTSQLDVCYPTIIQSGGNYSLKFTALSGENYLHFGTIICSLGVRYTSYCSNIVRTIFVNPPKGCFYDDYLFIINLEEEILKELVPGLDTRLDTSKKIQKNSCKRIDYNGTLLKHTQFSLLLHSLLLFY